MTFWMVMAIFNLMIPFIMIVVGYVFVKHPPKTINGILEAFTLDTLMSMHFPIALSMESERVKLGRPW